jgi:DNA-binding MarR family transcriptional regulator
MWSELVELTDEVRRTHNALAAVVDDLHAERAIPVRLRAALEYLERHGPATVPEIARARGVTRQHIQTTVNELLDRSLVEYRPNPHHRRSHLVALTNSGAETIAAMQTAERGALEPSLPDWDRADLVSATATLRSLRLALPDLHARPDAEEIA